MIIIISSRLISYEIQQFDHRIQSNHLSSRTPAIAIHTRVRPRVRHHWRCDKSGSIRCETYCAKSPEKMIAR